MKNPALLLCLILAGVVMSAEPAGSVRPQILDLRCEYQENPLAIESAAPRLSWRLASPARGAAQTAWQILVASSPAALAENRGDLWDSGKVASGASSQIAYQGRALAARESCHWKVRVWDEHGEVSAWSPAASWMMGLLQPADWRAQWIAARDPEPVPTDLKPLHLTPARHYRKEFNAGKPVARATAFVSALGLFDLHLNGQRVGDAYFQPGWSDYAKRAYYRALDVTALVQSGRNALGAVVADGWYAGYIGFGRLNKLGPNGLGRYFYGKTPALLVQLELTYADGSHETVLSDPSWRVTDAGPIREADLLMGEAHDARREMTGWDRAGFDDRGWAAAIPAAANGERLVTHVDRRGDPEVNLGFQAPPVLQAYSAPPIRITQELPAKAITEPSPGVHIFDFGQNFAGNIRLRVKGAAGTTLKLRYGEMLHPNGQLMTENLRAARATDFYTLRGDPAGETWTPRFTYHGFQYAELTGIDGKPPLETLTGLVIHNDTPLTGQFECSDPVLTQFARNAVWTQRANFVEVPTDCPQRDERLGWAGDAQAYIRTASYNADIAAFFTKWLGDVTDAQLSFGAYPDYVPYPLPTGYTNKDFATGWTDVGIICPWTIWRVYGDTRLVERHWASMTRFMEWRLASSTREGLGLDIGNFYADWLNQNDPTPADFIDTCYHAWDCQLMAQMAEATGRTREAAMYRRRFELIRGGFAKAYVKEDGALGVPSQTAHVLALWSGLVPEAQQAATTRHLLDKIKANGFRMTTGFLGTRALLPVLSAHGHHDEAVRLFQSRRFPSWGYEVANGANTVWERWDSYTVDKGFQNAEMNSFSHYALGAVMEWAYQTLAGIDTAQSGFQQIRIHPRPPKISAAAEGEQAPLSWVKASYHSPHGPISTHWRRDGRTYTLAVTLPANTSGTIWLPARTADAVTEGGRPLAQSRGLEIVGPQEDGLLLRAPSGSYAFSVALPDDYQ